MGLVWGEGIKQKKTQGNFLREWKCSMSYFGSCLKSRYWSKTQVEFIVLCVNSISIKKKLRNVLVYLTYTSYFKWTRKGKLKMKRIMATTVATITACFSCARCCSECFASIHSFIFSTTL